MYKCICRKEAASWFSECEGWKWHFLYMNRKKIFGCKYNVFPRYAEHNLLGVTTGGIV